MFSSSWKLFTCMWSTEMCTMTYTLHKIHMWNLFFQTWCYTVMCPEHNISSVSSKSNYVWQRDWFLHKRPANCLKECFSTTTSQFNEVIQIALYFPAFVIIGSCDYCQLFARRNFSCFIYDNWKNECFNFSTNLLWKSAAKAFLTIHFIFVRLHLKWAAILESGHKIGNKSLKWSIKLKNRSCSLRKAAIHNSVSWTFLAIVWSTNTESIHTKLGSISSLIRSTWYCALLCFFKAVTTAANSFLHTLQLALSALLFTGSLKIAYFSHFFQYFCLYLFFPRSTGSCKYTYYVTIARQI